MASADSGADRFVGGGFWVRERTVRLSIASLVLVFGCTGLVLVFSEDGPSTTALRVVACAMIATTVPAALLAARTDLVSFWGEGQSRLMTPAHILVVYGDIGVTTVLCTFSNRETSLYGATLLTLLSVYAAHFARPLVRNLHLVVTTAVIVTFGVLLWRSAAVDTAGAVARILVGVVVVNGTVLLQSMFSVDVRRDVGNSARRAHQDELTLLANRRGFFYSACAAILNCRAQFGVLFIDIDNFKQVNDRHGHHTGDDVLCSAADRLAVAVDGYGVLGRVGGDEFALVAEASVDELRELARRIQAAVHHTDDPHPVTVTVGIAWCATDGAARPHDVPAAEALLARALRAADAAMYRGKQAGRDRVVVADDMH